MYRGNSDQGSPHVIERMFTAECLLDVRWLFTKYLQLRSPRLFHLISTVFFIVLNLNSFFCICLFFKTIKLIELMEELLAEINGVQKLLYEGFKNDESTNQEWLNVS